MTNNKVPKPPDFRALYLYHGKDFWEALKVFDIEVFTRPLL